MITFPERIHTSPYLEFVDAHELGYNARRAGKSLKGLIFRSEAQELGFKAGWDMGGVRSLMRQERYWSQLVYWEIWDKGAMARHNSAEYENPYSRGSWRWRAFLAGWFSRNCQKLMT